MSVFDCNKHGVSGFVESCEHVRYLVANGRIKEIKNIGLSIYSLIICDDCIKIFDLHKYVINQNKHCDSFGESTELELEEFFDAYEKINNRIGWCIQCYQELLDQHKANIKPPIR